MGCGASKVTPQSTDAKCLQVNGDGKAVEVEPASNGHANGYVNRQNLKPNERKDSDSKPRISELNGNVPTKSQGDKDVSSHQALEETRHLSIGSGGVGHQISPPPPSKAVAFDILLGQNGSIPLSNRPPRRLQKIESAPILTREALEQKQAAAEQNRQKELEKKVKLMSKRRSELILAREMDRAEQQKAELAGKLAASEKKREKAQAEIKEKQRRREEKARRVRMKARQMKDGDDVADLNVDPDETYNADEEDQSWDVGSPESFSRSMDQDDDNNNQRFDDREGADNEKRTEDRQQNRDEMHDFFDS